MRNTYLLALVLVLSACSDTPDGTPVVDLGSMTEEDLGTIDANGQNEPDLGTVGDDWAEVPECDEIQAKVDQAVEDSGHPGLAMAFADAEAKQLCAVASGYSKVESMEAWDPSRLSRIGSVTKTFTAAIIYQLIDEGTVTMTDPLEDWVPGYYDGVGVTIEHLMTNTSGIVSYNYVGSFDDTRPWTPTELVQWAVDREPDLHFEPGTQWEYSNTNWILLGLVIEAATGGTYEDAIQARLLDPLGLHDTYVAGSGDDNPDVVDCYDDNLANTTGVADPSFGWAAGAIVSSPSDLARWGAALFGGDVISAASLERMTTPTVLTDGTVTEYGAGAFLEIDGDIAIYGHTGGIGGYLTYMYYWKSDGYVLVVMANQFGAQLRDLAGYGWAVPLGLDYP